jgi:hypothetical protein
MNYVGGFNCSACPVGYPGEPYLFYPDAPRNYTIVGGGCSVAVTRKTSLFGGSGITNPGDTQETVIPITQDINQDVSTGSFWTISASLFICTSIALFL